MSVKDELANVIEKMVEEQVSEQMRIIEEKYFAKSKQTRFTQAELAEKWGCSKGYVNRLLKKYGIEPIGKRGKEYEYDGDQAEEVKAVYDDEVLYQEQLNWKIRAM
ncbi:MarR family transcriptional regulator [Enterococcus faecalis]|uniref:MarR family transcriptional regulator n=1 Tax=Enterococcus faecalis TaxID=1351 RepID=UPI002DBEE7C4|nr:MarR family transcriptional regulator [Enterococcus faecalis]MEB7428341.1 MarR family transcriptional regulator [Enterococcus faecalis]